MYWTNYGDWTDYAGAGNGAIMKVPLEGGTPTVLASERCYPGDIAVDETSVYWTEGGCGDPISVMKVPLDSGPSVLVAPECGGSMAIAGDFVYCFGVQQSPGAVMKVPMQGGAATPVAPYEGLPVALTVDSANVFWITLPSIWEKAGTLHKVSLDGGPSIVLVPTLAPGPIASDGRDVYWTDAEGGELRKVHVDGGDPVTVAGGEDGMSVVAIHDAHVYWSTCTGGSGTQPNHRNVLRAATAGGDPEVLAVFTSCGTASIAVDAESVYLVEWDAGTVLKAPHE